MQAYERYLAWSLAGTIIIAAILLPFASSHPDGLEKVAEHLGFAGRATSMYNGSPMPDYVAFGGGYLSSLFSMVLGSLLVLAASFAAGFMLKRRKGAGR